MTIDKIRRFGTASAPNRLALKSPSVYLRRINKVNPAWGTVCLEKGIQSALVGCALWAAAVTVANGCRISEILRIRSNQVRPNGMAWAVGSKGSNARLIYLGLDCSEAFELYNSVSKFDVFFCNYQDVYRACLAYGFAEFLPNHQHRAVTHAGRYHLAQEVAQSAGEEKAGEVLGHKSKTAVEHYTHPERCKKKVSKKQANCNFQNLEDLLDLLT